ncbi:Beta-lactamase class C protein [Cystobacter fuscus DSM 2262]|uniref:Beta-lactamase class C protein n=1 Tax=Cystobacter fuscus (strain ATCC 25194 / DSM 2262 / NBRC 100088 / M29) TaxID=1242864 RepID=S9QLB5_CYSF2|nr:hydrolase [Cystobacter fuscus]EPX57278.1 Beta-lactamase class C protein [Cystobacter fuscus DSM 2262]
MRTKVGSSFTAVTLGLLLSGLAVAEERSVSARLDAVIEQALADKRVVGTVVVVARDGQVIYHRAAGEADREAHTPMREDTIFRFASMSKPLVSAAALALVDQGKLGLEDPVTRWLPDFRPRLADGREAVITVRQLLTHTAGLNYGFLEPEDGPYHRAGVSNGMDAPGLGLEENLRRIASVPLAYEPGTRWGYSVATDVLGAVVARAGGAPLPKVVERLVTRPLGLRDTGFTVKEPKRLATPYADGKPEPVRMGELHVVPWGASSMRFVPGRVFNARSFASGGGGMVGTAGDFLKFLEAVRTGGAPVLKPATATLVSTGQIGALEMPGSPGWTFGFGASVLVDATQAGTPQSVGTWQWGGAYGHHWFVDPKRRLSVVVLTNTAIEGLPGAFPAAIRDALYVGPPEQDAAQVPTGAPPAR